jgi:hypothetical protein
MWCHHVCGSVCTPSNNCLNSYHTVTEVGMNVTLLVATKALMLISYHQLLQYEVESDVSMTGQQKLSVVNL